MGSAAIKNEGLSELSILLNRSVKACGQGIPNASAGGARAGNIVDLRPPVAQPLARTKFVPASHSIAGLFFAFITGVALCYGLLVPHAYSLAMKSQAATIATFHQQPGARSLAIDASWPDTVARFNQYLAEAKRAEAAKEAAKNAENAKVLVQLVSWAQQNRH